MQVQRADVACRALDACDIACAAAQVRVNDVGPPLLDDLGESLLCAPPRRHPGRGGPTAMTPRWPARSTPAALRVRAISSPPSVRWESVIAVLLQSLWDRPLRLRPQASERNRVLIRPAGRRAADRREPVRRDRSGVRLRRRPAVCPVGGRVDGRRGDRHGLPHRVVRRRGRGRCGGGAAVSLRRGGRVGRQGERTQHGGAERRQLQRGMQVVEAGKGGNGHRLIIDYCRRPGRAPTPRTRPGTGRRSADRRVRRHRRA